MSDKVVDYMEMIARAAEEERAKREESTVLPEPAGEEVVDYLAASQAWKENRGWMDSVQDD